MLCECIEHYTVRIDYNQDFYIYIYVYIKLLIRWYSNILLNKINKKGGLKETPSNTKTRKMRYLEGIKMFLKMQVQFMYMCKQVEQ